jgi:signal transduction histidine kinase
MNLTLDNATLLLVAGTLYLLLPLSVWLILRMPRQRAPLVWCTGGMVGGVGLLLIGARGQIHDVVSYAVGQPLLAVGAWLTAQSLRIDIGRAWSWWLIGLGTLAYAGLLALLLPLASAPTLGVVIRLANLGVLLLLIWAAWQVSQAEKSRNALTIAAAYALQAGGVLANLWAAAMGSSDIVVATSGPVGVAVSLLTLLVALVASMAYLGLALDRAELSHLSVARQVARTQQRQERRQALVHLDRERLLSMLTDSLGHAMTQPLTAALLRVETELRALQLAPLNVTRLQTGLTHVVSELRRTGETVERIRHFLRPAPTQGAPVNLTAVLRQVHLLLRQEAINRQTALQFPARMPAVWVLGDELQLAQAVLQLVRNAMDAVNNSALKRVTVTLESGPEQVRLCVRDTGPGLPAEVLQREPDAVAHQAHSLQGIGLFVVESIARQHHGSLLLDNLASLGAVVTLVLPCHHAHDASDESAPFHPRPEHLGL